MADSSRRHLRALAQQHGLSDHSLTLIMESVVRLTDAQIGTVIDAVETCVLSGLTEADVARVIARHRQRSPADWRSSFWSERMRLAGENYNRQQAAAAAPANGGPAVVPIVPEPPAATATQSPPVGPIPPQPPAEVGTGASAPAEELGVLRNPIPTAAKQAA